MDNFIADQYHKKRWHILQKLIPDRTYYTQETEKFINRYNTAFYIQPSDFQQWLLFSDHPDNHVEIAAKIINPALTSLILDIGANCGNFSLIMSQRIKENRLNKKIISFEPNPRIFNRIKRNLDLNPELKEILKLENMGIGQDTSIMELQLPLRNSGAASFVRNYEHEPHEKFKVHILSLDNYLSENKLLIEFIKIDVENFEYFVLKGAENTIFKHRPSIYIEMGLGQLKIKDIIIFFKNMEYTLYGEFEKKFILLMKEDILEVTSFRNMLAIYKSEYSIEISL